VQHGLPGNLAIAVRSSIFRSDSLARSTFPSNPKHLIHFVSIDEIAAAGSQQAIHRFECRHLVARNKVATGGGSETPQAWAEIVGHMRAGSPIVPKNSRNLPDASDTNETSLQTIQARLNRMAPECYKCALGKPG
jgi:hypothetical protein